MHVTYLVSINLFKEQRQTPVALLHGGRGVIYPGQHFRRGANNSKKIKRKDQEKEKEEFSRPKTEG